MQWIQIMALLLFLGGCASQKVVETTTDTASLAPVQTASNLKALKLSAFKFAEEDFKKSAERNEFEDDDELTLQDHPYKFKGKTHPPLSMDRSTAWLTQKELGKESIKQLAPIDLVVSTEENFLFLYKHRIYIGETASNGGSQLRVLKAEPLLPVKEEVKAQKGVTDSSLWFESLVLDLDRAIQEGKRESSIETAITGSIVEH